MQLRALALGSLLIAATLVPGLVQDGRVLSAALVLVFLVLWVLLPGLGCARFLGREEDELAELALGLVMGLVLLGLVVFGCRAAGDFTLLRVWPLAALAFGMVNRRRARATAQQRAGSPASARALGFLLAVVVLFLLRAPARSGDPDTWWWGFDSDLLFHAGNASELTRTGALLDPRVGGYALNYHLFAHTLAASATLITETPIAELYRVWIIPFHPLVVVLLVFVLARELARSDVAGFVAALGLVLHTDIGSGLHELGLGEKRAIFQSYLDLALFHSPTTACGLLLLLAIGLVLLRCHEPGAGRGRWLQLGLLGCACSVAKGSVMPIAIAGTAFALFVSSLAARRLELRWLAAVLVLGVAAAPGTLFLALGPGSFAGAMFRVVPFSAVYSSSVVTPVLYVPGRRAKFLLIGALTSPVWLLGYLGLQAVGGLLWLVAGRPSLRGIGPWILGVVGAGLGATLLLRAPQSSELFFAYNAQVLLSVVAGVGVAKILAGRRPFALAALVFAVPWLVAGVGGVLGSMRLHGDPDEELRGLWPQWMEGARLLRDYSEPDALLVTRHEATLASVFAERRCAFETTTFRPEAHAARWKRVRGVWHLGKREEHPFPVLEAARDRVLESADAAAIAALRDACDHRGPLYIVSDAVEVSLRPVVEVAVRPRVESPALEGSQLLERWFANEAIAIYRVME
jgi:hypothetical protein